ncbi:hypothetical protein U1Q18_045736, partial [Sarracenia purpurea var. burkii]
MGDGVFKGVLELGETEMVGGLKVIDMNCQESNQQFEGRWGWGKKREEAEAEGLVAGFIWGLKFA